MSEWLLRALHMFNNLNDRDDVDTLEGIPDDCLYCLDRYVKSQWRLLK